MEIEQYLQLVRKRRSIRKFKTTPIPDEYVEKILEAGRWAMSGANGQSWEFIVVRDQETKDRIAEEYIKIRERIHKIEKTRVEELRHPMFAVTPVGRPGFQDAPVIIIIIGDRRTYQASVLAPHFHLESDGGVDATYLKGMGNTAMLIHLAVATLGLGSQWFSVPGIFEPFLKKLLDVPVELTIHTMVPIGYPAYEPPPSYRRELREIVHYEKYDHSKYRSDDDIYNFLINLRRYTKLAYSPAYGEPETERKI